MSNKLTFKQQAFIDHYTGDCKGNASEAAKKAGYSGNSNTLGQRAYELVNNSKVIKVMARLKADLAAESEYTRERQLKALGIALSIAQGQKSASAMVAAVREQNEMLGYHRENAPNAEREAAKKARMTAQQERIASKLAREIVDEESGECSDWPRIAQEAG